MAPPITRQKAIPREPGGARHGEEFPHGRVPVRPEDRT